MPVQKHGLSKTPEYRIWAGMITRCNNQKSLSYKRYGGRGIKVCDRWQGENGFENFIKDMGKKPWVDYSLGRIDNNGDYEPSNCRWETKRQQTLNRAPYDKRITYKNETHCVGEWAVIYNIPQAILLKRINEGMSLKQAISVDTSADFNTKTGRWNNLFKKD